MRKSIWCVTIIENGYPFSWEGTATSQQEAEQKARNAARSRKPAPQRVRSRNG